MDQLAGDSAPCPLTQPAPDQRIQPQTKVQPPPQHCGSRSLERLQARKEDGGARPQPPLEALRRASQRDPPPTRKPPDQAAHWSRPAASVPRAYREGDLAHMRHLPGGTIDGTPLTDTVPYLHFTQGGSSQHPRPHGSLPPQAPHHGRRPAAPLQVRQRDREVPQGVRRDHGPAARPRMRQGTYLDRMINPIA